MRTLGNLTLATLALLPLSLRADSKVVAAGTEIAIRTNVTIDSKTAEAGQTVAAVVERDVNDGSGAVEIPKGSEAQLILRKVSGGGITGGSGLVLDLHSVNIGGQQYMVNTTSIQKSNQRGIGRNRRTAEMTGGGAALGTLIGAVAGGGKGAILGAIFGAAAGGTAQVLTKGKETRIPAESVLTFRLSQPLQLDTH